jgi:hypothetical protein
LSSDQSLELINNLLSFTVSVDDYKATFDTSVDSSLDNSYLDHSNDSSLPLN